MSEWRRALRKQIQTAPALPGAPIVNWGKLPDNHGSDCAVRLFVMADPRPRHFKGFQGLRQSRVQIDVFHTVSARLCAELAEAIIAKIENPWTDAELGVRFEAPGVEGPGDSGAVENSLYAYRCRLDVMVWHAKTT